MASFNSYVSLPEGNHSYNWGYNPLTPRVQRAEDRRSTAQGSFGLLDALAPALCGAGSVPCAGTSPKRTFEWENHRSKWVSFPAFFVAMFDQAPNMGEIQRKNDLLGQHRAWRYSNGGLTGWPPSKMENDGYRVPTITDGSRGSIHCGARSTTYSPFTIRHVLYQSLSCWKRCWVSCHWFSAGQTAKVTALDSNGDPLGIIAHFCLGTQSATRGAGGGQLSSLLLISLSLRLVLHQRLGGL